MSKPDWHVECKTCDNQGWVCEGHRDRPWEGLSDRDDACHCGPGVLCPDCVPDGESPDDRRYMASVICGEAHPDIPREHPQAIRHPQEATNG